MNKVIFIFISFCFMSVVLFAQEARLVDCPIEQANDVALWDKLISEKLETLYPGKQMLEHLSSISFYRMLKNADVQLVDVRTQAEYDEGHIAGAVLIDVRGEDFEQQIDKLLVSNKPVAVYCRGGVRSRKASEKLLLKGFQVYNLDKGFAQWKQDGMN